MEINEQNFLGLKSNQFQLIDHLYNLLLGSKDLNQFLKTGLEWIISCLNRPGGAFFMVHPCIEASPEWIKINIPDIWEQQLSDPQSKLIVDALQVFSTLTPSCAYPSLQVSTMVPISSPKETFGVFILSGDRLNQEEQELLNLFLYIFPRLITSHMHAFVGWREENENTILHIISSSFRVMYTDPSLALFRLLQGVRQYFHSEYLLFVQQDPQTRELVSKKLVDDGDDWVYQVSELVPQGLIDKLFDSKNPVDFLFSTGDNVLLPDILNLKEQNIHSMAFTPIISKNGHVMGTMIFANLKYRISPLEKGEIAKINTYLADFFENYNFLQKLKISLAKLEVRHVELLNSRNNLRTMFDNIPNSIYIVDPSYIIQIINKARAGRSDKKPNKVVGKTCYEALYGRKSPCTACRVNETLREGNSTNRVWREWTSSETYLDWEINTHPIFDEMHTPVQAILFEVDITEKRNLEANLIQSEKLAAVGQLAAGIAHEINNPLSAIIANAQILLQETPKDNADEIESLKLIETAGIRASQVVRNLLSISRKENLDFEPTDINGTIRNALVLIQHELLKRPISVKIDFSENMPPILAQQDHLQGVWINLFMNAIDAITAADRAEGHLAIKTWFDEKEIHVGVSDNGNGIEQEKIKKIFEPFYTTKSVGRGTGLGLSVCMRVIKEHQGNISIESQPGQGTRFSISLPVSIDNIPE